MCFFSPHLHGKGKDLENMEVIISYFGYASGYEACCFGQSMLPCKISGYVLHLKVAM